MSAEASRLLVQNFVSCHRNYCNSLLYKISDTLLSSYQPADVDCHYPSCDWHLELRVQLHHASSALSTLVVSSPENYFQCHHLGKCLCGLEQLTWHLNVCSCRIDSWLELAAILACRGHVLFGLVCDFRLLPNSLELLAV